MAGDDEQPSAELPQKEACVVSAQAESSTNEKELVLSKESECTKTAEEDEPNNAVTDLLAERAAKLRGQDEAKKAEAKEQQDALRLEFKTGLDCSLVESWLRPEPITIQNALDPFSISGTPPTVDGLAEDHVRGCLDEVLTVAEPWRRGKLTRLQQVMVWKGSDCVGFSTFGLVQRPETDANGVCRICYEGAGDGELVEGCACRGSTRYVHSACLVMQWEAKGKPTAMACELCKQPFILGAGMALADAFTANVEKIKKEKPHVNTQEKKAMLMSQIGAATTFWTEGSLSQAENAFEEVLRGLKEIEDEESVKTLVLTAHHNLGLVLQDQGKLDKAHEHIHAAGVGFTEKFGEKHPHALKALHNEALIAQNRGLFREAERIYQKVLVFRREVCGPKDVNTLKTSINLGLVLHQLGRSAEALEISRTTCSYLAQAVGREHPLSLIAMQNLSLVMAALDPMSDEALKLAREAAEGRLTALGSENPTTFEGLRDLATLLNARGEHEEAEKLYRQALAGQQRLLGFSHSVTQETLRQLRKSLEQRGDTLAAEKLQKEHSSGVSVEASPLPSKPGPIVAVVFSIYIIPAFRRQGIGKAVMQHWLKEAKAAAATALEFWAFAHKPGEDRAALTALTKSVGLVEIAERTSKVGVKAVYSHLRCDLKE